jgi:hypothetical protein
MMGVTIHLFKCSLVVSIQGGIEQVCVCINMYICLAILMNVRDVVRLSSSWDDDDDAVGELNKLLVPVLMKALDFDIQQAATNTISAVSSGVSTNASTR